MATVCEQQLVHEVIYEGQLLGIIISADFRKPGIHFFTPNTLSQQIAYMRHPAGKSIQPHVHNPVPREVCYTQEVLVIKRGKLKVDFYTEQRQYLESHVLQAGDVILLVQGGHGFEVLEEVEMIEVKQGPYVGEQDKTRFDGSGGNFHTLAMSQPESLARVPQRTEICNETSKLLDSVPAS